MDNMKLIHVETKEILGLGAQIHHCISLLWRLSTLVHDMMVAQE